MKSKILNISQINSLISANLAILKRKFLLFICYLNYQIKFCLIFFLKKLYFFFIKNLTLKWYIKIIIFNILKCPHAN